MAKVVMVEIVEEIENGERVVKRVSGEDAQTIANVLDHRCSCGGGIDLSQIEWEMF